MRPISFRTVVLVLFALAAGWLVPTAGITASSLQGADWESISYTGTTERSKALLFIHEAFKKPQTSGRLGYYPNGLNTFMPTFTIAVVETDGTYEIRLEPPDRHGNRFFFVLDAQTGRISDVAEGFGLPPRLPEKN